MGDQPQPLTKAIEEAKQDWYWAKTYFNFVSDHDLVDYAIYRIDAAEKKYMYLLKKARQEGLRYSPYEGRV